ncbi:ECF sigma factor [Phycisphaerae bacterium RAS1]|nr:ECF sigma factor [Phycisphaerae bacterium RAS1]
MGADGDIRLTQLLEAAGGGDREAVRRVWERVHTELHRMAVAQLARDGLRAVLRPTSLVAEAYLRLVGPADGNHWANHRHFFVAAAETLRRVRVDRARMHRAAKRGGGASPEPLRDEHVAVETTEDRTDVVALDEALNALEKESPRAAEVVKLRYFAGHLREEIAAMLNISPRTVDYEWRYAKSWLFAALSG